MKRRLLAATIIPAILATGAIVNAGPGNIRFTAHNMSNNNDVAKGLTQAQRHQVSLSTEEVCIFCHTPHNAQPAVPLWNKVNPTQAFKMYTSSRSLTNVAKAVTAPGPESLLCLSCHDGRTAINVLHNSKVGQDYSGKKKVDIGNDYNDPGAPAELSGTGVPLQFFTFGGIYRANLGQTTAYNTGLKRLETTNAYAGNNLMDDHPISFSYTAAYNEKVSKGSNALKDINTIDARIRFYGSNMRMECSSCHDPHVAYGYTFDRVDTGIGDKTLTPFLVRANSGSALCLSCHNK